MRSELSFAPTNHQKYSTMCARVYVRDGPKTDTKRPKCISHSFIHFQGKIQVTYVVLKQLRGQRRESSFVFCISRFILLVFRFQCFDATVYTVNKVVQKGKAEQNHLYRGMYSSRQLRETYR